MALSGIDIVIPLYNGSSTINACLDGIRGQTIPEDHDVRVIVVDDASTDRSASETAQYTGLEIDLLYNRQNLGRARTLNHGMRHGNGQIVVFLDCDCVFENEDVLGRYAKLLEQGWDCVFSGVVSEREDFTGRYTNDLSKMRFESARKGQFHAMTSAGLAIRRPLLTEMGGFCEEYTRYGFEDRDFIAMLQQRGARLTVDEKCMVCHQGAIDPAAVSRKLIESAAFSAPVFSRRFPDAYARSVYGKIDPRHRSALPARFLAAISSALPLVLYLARVSVASPFVPYRVKKALMKAVSFLSYVKGCR